MTQQFPFFLCKKRKNVKKETNYQQNHQGHKYDTETANYIGEVESKLKRGEVLYRNRTGEFFQWRWTCWQDEDDAIVPLTENRARDWVAENLTADDYEALGGQSQNIGTRVIVARQGCKF